MDGYPAGAICLSDCDTACAWSGSVGDLQADTSPWLGTRVARVLEFAGLIPVGIATALLIWTLIIGIAHAPNAVRLGLVPSVFITDGPYRFTRNPMYVAELALWLGWALFFGSPGRFSGMYCTAASCESRNCASGRTEFGSSIRSGLSYVQEAGAPLVGTSQQPEIGAVMARSARA
jgi:hypothetical protein